MQTKITIRNEAQTCYIDIEGIIGVPEQSQFDGSSSSVATFEAFRREVASLAEVAATKVVVNIRSTGGDVNDALLIYDALQSLDAKITTRCYGYTASAATIIAQAADKGCREISSNALYLIHNSMCAIEGNASALETRAELLKKTDERLAHLYAQHSSHDVEYFASLMAENNGEGRWLSAEETIEAGLADRIIDNLIVGSLVPENGQESEQEGEDATSTETSVESAEPASTTVQTPQAKACNEQDVKRALNRAAGTLLGYLLNRFSYRWEQWMESLRSKREERRKERIKEQQSNQQGEPQNGEKVATEPSAATTAETATSAATSATTDNLPQAAANSTAHRSAIRFSEEQSRLAPSKLKSVEAPSMHRPSQSLNESAYAEDARAFSRG